MPKDGSPDNSSAPEDTPSSGADSVSFEDSLSDLQQIVSRLESGDLGLDASLAEFERGVALMRSCQEFLRSAERKVELLTGFDADGEPVTEPFDETATEERARGKSSKSTKRKSDKKPPATRSLLGDEDDELDTDEAPF